MFKYVLVFTVGYMVGVYKTRYEVLVALTKAAGLVKEKSDEQAS